MKWVSCSQWVFRTTMPALLPFLFLSTASVFLSWDEGLAWVRKEDSHSWASRTWHCLDGERIAGGGMAGSHAVSDGLGEVNQNQLTMRCSLLPAVWNRMASNWKLKQMKTKAGPKVESLQCTNQAALALESDRSLEPAGIICFGFLYW